MIHDIAPHRYDVAYRSREMNESDIILIYNEKGLLCRMEDGEIVYPIVGEMAGACSDIWIKAEYLFGIDDIRYFGMRGSLALESEAWNYIAKEELRKVRPIWKAFAGVTGFQMCKWYMEHQFCGCCGTKMKPHDKERAMRCQNCGRICYPQICPSVIVGVINEDKILLTKYAPNHSDFKKYALVAGYVEIGESLEDAIRREVMEEVGICVKNIRYYKSQPWSFSDALLMGFFCETDGNADISIDREELSEAEWFDRSNLPKERSEASVSLTGEMMEAFRKGIV